MTLYSGDRGLFRNRKTLDKQNRQGVNGGFDLDGQGMGFDKF